MSSTKADKQKIPSLVRGVQKSRLRCCSLVIPANTSIAVMSMRREPAMLKCSRDGVCRDSKPPILQADSLRANPTKIDVRFTDQGKMLQQLPAYFVGSCKIANKMAMHA